MEHFIRVVMEKQDTLAEGLNDDVFPGSEVMETEQGATVFHIPLPKALSEQESDEFADRLVNYMTKKLLKMTMTSFMSTVRCGTMMTMIQWTKQSIKDVKLN